MSETESLLTVSRDAVYQAADAYLDANMKTPATTGIREQFDTPTSPAIAVYLREWKHVNQDKIMLLSDGKAAWKAKAQTLEIHLEQASEKLSSVQYQLQSVYEWLLLNHSEVYTEWMNQGISE